MSGQRSSTLKERYYCAPRPPMPVVLPQGISSNRASAIRIGAKKWVNGTVLHYAFLDSTDSHGWSWTDDQKTVVQTSFQTWKDVGIGLSFVEVAKPEQAEIVIGCLQGDGSWSFVGTDSLSEKDRGRTINFGWDLTTDWGKATALHEIGHAIGMSHEHQNPKAGLIWNEDKVYAYFGGSPNFWDRTTISNNILAKLDLSEVDGSDWDPGSIMEYPFEPGLIKAPKPYDDKGIGENLGISDQDRQWVRTWYPSTGAPEGIGVMQLARLQAVAGQQRDYLFQPETTRDYTVQTVGESDCKLVIFQTVNGQQQFYDAKDDSGTPENAVLKLRMLQGQRYTIRVRVNFVKAPDGVGLLIL